jgi:hypothetical protein
VERPGIAEQNETAEAECDCLQNPRNTRSVRKSHGSRNGGRFYLTWQFRYQRSSQFDTTRPALRGCIAIKHLRCCMCKNHRSLLSRSIERRTTAARQRSPSPRERTQPYPDASIPPGSDIPSTSRRARTPAGLQKNNCITKPSLAKGLTHVTRSRFREHEFRTGIASKSSDPAPREIPRSRLITVEAEAKARYRDACARRPSGQHRFWLGKTVGGSLVRELGRRQV